MWDNLPDAAAMSHDDRLAELVDITANKMVLEIQFSKFRARIESLMQRPVYTHEFARPDNLVNELRSGKPASFDEVAAKVDPAKLLVVDC